VIGSRSGATSAAMRASRASRLVADVSSSRRRHVAPASSASCMLAACEVEPEASRVEKARVARPSGRR
jgi:hypothetical protein